MRADTSNWLTSGRSNTLRESETWEKVESKKWKDNNRAADDRLSRKSRKKKKKKNKERDFRSGSWDPGGGEEGGEGMRCAQGPPGAGPFRPPPVSFLPLPSPRRGAHTRPNQHRVVQTHFICHSLQRNGKAAAFAFGECKISNFHYSIIDYLLNG